MVKVNNKLYVAVDDNKRKHPKKRMEYWTYIGTCSVSGSCEDVKEWRPYKWFKKGTIVTDKQKRYLYEALKKAHGKSRKPGTPNGNTYWKTIGEC